MLVLSDYKIFSTFPHFPHEQLCSVSCLLANSRNAAIWIFLNIVPFYIALLYRPVLSSALDMLSGAPSVPELCSLFKVFAGLSVASITSLLLVCAKNVVKQPCLDSAWVVWYIFHNAYWNNQTPALFSIVKYFFPLQFMHLFYMFFSHYFHLCNLIHSLNNAPITVGVFDQEYGQVILMFHR